ncbi:S-layer homology domain-containing protein [Marinicrinis sediminis]|uniref:S-layer homology domain-containing protein n=1 Tax=Marinicrinis sediminis TaxID=1652465 RepID=A0ABW5RB66_9BACL
MKKQILTLTAVLSLTVTSLLTPSSLEPAAKAAETKSVTRFKDVSTSHWANSAITWAVKENIVAGYPDETFKPSKSVTRAEFIKMLVDALHIPHSSGSTPWYQAYVHEAIEAGLHSEADFKAYDKPITRYEIAKIVANSLATLPEYEAYLESFGSLYYMDLPFTDHMKFSKAEVPYVALSYATRIINGYPDESFGKDKPATRAEAVAMLQSLTGVMKKNPNSFQYLNELMEIATYGSNGETMSNLERKANILVDDMTVEHGNYTATLKRLYVIPFEGDKKSMFERKFVGDRDEIHPWYAQSKRGLAVGVVDITFKKEGSINLFTSNLFVSPFPGFGEQLPSERYNFIFEYMNNPPGFKKGETREVVIYGAYENSSISVSFLSKNNQEGGWIQLFFNPDNEYLNR